jgi:hypothetical protein
VGITFSDFCVRVRSELLKQRIGDVATELGLSHKYLIDSELKESTLVHVINDDIRRPSFVSSIENYLNSYLAKFGFIHIMFFLDPGNPTSPYCVFILYGFYFPLIPIDIHTEN